MGTASSVQAHYRHKSFQVDSSSESGERLKRTSGEWDFSTIMSPIPSRIHRSLEEDLSALRLFSKMEYSKGVEECLVRIRDQINLGNVERVREDALELQNSVLLAACEAVKPISISSQERSKPSRRTVSSHSFDSLGGSAEGISD